MSDTRARRLAGQIQVIVAELLERRVKDPRLGFVTITEARVTGDLREATVFYTVLDEPTPGDTARALESVKGLLRSEVGRQTGIKFAPTLAFVPDAVPENARAIDDLLRAASASDAAVAAQAEGAQYAGDADPYVHADEVDEEHPNDAETGPEQDVGVPGWGEGEQDVR
jgi:ribosome-binding factor A